MAGRGYAIWGMQKNLCWVCNLIGHKKLAGMHLHTPLHTQTSTYRDSLMGPWVIVLDEEVVNVVCHQEAAGVVGEVPSDVDTGKFGACLLNL